MVRPHDRIDVSPVYIKFGARVIRDDHRYSVLTSRTWWRTRATSARSRRASAWARTVYPLHAGLGFGAALSPDFRGDNPGIVWTAAALTDSALASTLIGYQVGVTPLQMATAVSAVANGGECCSRASFGRDPRRVRAEVEKKVLRRAISRRTAAQLLPMLEAVVEKGTAKVAQMDGFTVAGKTGTAKKLVNGSYNGHSDYNASFVGFVPSRSPRYTIVVVVDSPHRVSPYGGVVAAPIFKRISEAVLRYEGVPRTINPVPQSSWCAQASRRRYRRASDDGRAIRQRYACHQPRRRAGSRRLERPRSAAQAGRGGPHAAWHGAGFVVAQDPVAGTPLPTTPSPCCGCRRPRAAPAGPARHDSRAVLQQRSAGWRAGDLEQAARLTRPCAGVAYDSRAVAPADLRALKGRHADGAAYTAQAAAAGASASWRGSGRPRPHSLDRRAERALRGATGRRVLRAPSAICAWWHHGHQWQTPPPISWRPSSRPPARAAG